MDGFAAEKALKQAREEEMLIEINWQDQDSSSENGFKKAYPEESHIQSHVVWEPCNTCPYKKLESISKDKEVQCCLCSKARAWQH